MRISIRFHMRLTNGGRLAGGLALCAALLGSAGAAGATGAGGAASRPAAAPTWVTTTGKVVRLSVISGWNNVNAGFNFNGAAHGQMVVTVPLGDKVIVTYKNDVTTPHNVDIIPYTQPLPGHGVAPAFPGASSPLPEFKPDAPPPQPRTFSFVASKAGTYMMVCGVAGHALAGMWDTFVVSGSATTASVTFNKAAVTTTTGTTAPLATPANWAMTTGKVVRLTLISGWNNANAGFNFNGGAYGRMVVTAPLGDKVMVTYKNNVAVFHDVDIIRYQTPLPSHSASPAFAGARSPLPQFKPGAPLPSSGKPVMFSFVADKAGTYMIICGVPGHALAGMWDTLVVSPTAKTASITFKS